MKEIFEFNTPETVIIGGGASSGLTQQVLNLGGKKVLIVTDPFILGTGIIENLVKKLDAEKIETVVFSEVQPDPTVNNVKAGLELLHSSHANIIIAIGGGSPIDAAKAIAVMATNEAPLSNYMGYHKISRKGIPLIAIPTTAGTGSEASKVTVITDTEKNVKMMIFDKYLMPTVALVDFQLSVSMPRPLTAHVGVDTLTHGIEAYVSKKANAMTNPLALSCIDLVSRNLFKAWNNPGDVSAREAMALAAFQGGMAFTNSSVCLVHGMSRPLGALFHLAHGLSNAVLLPVVTRFSVMGNWERYATIARLMKFAKATESDEVSAMKLVDGLGAFNKNLEIPRLRDCGNINANKFEESLEKMAQDAITSGSPQNNPVVPTIKNIIGLYGEAW
ncbi:iron-containing alcohol dehydrogenase [soil metagenome]